MEYLHNGFTLDICQGGFPLSTDSMLLSGFVHLPKNAKVLDLGSGCGTLGLLLCAKDDQCRVTGIELDPDSHRTSVQNSTANGLSSRLSSICADMDQISSLLPAGSFDCCISNPPYFSGGPESVRTPNARNDRTCCPDTLFRSAAWALRYGGDFFLVHKPEKLAQLCADGARHGLEAKRLCLVRHRPDRPVALILLQLRKGGKPGLQWEEVCLQDTQGNPTEYYRQLYHLQEA